MLGCYGAASLPTRPWAFALLVLSILAFAVDVQTGVPRFWTGVGVVGFVVASVFLYDGLSLSWITLLAGIGGVLLAFLTGMPAMVRTRFATPTIGREWMIGEMGGPSPPSTPRAPSRSRGATWRARTNRATPIAAGERHAGRGHRRRHPRGGAGVGRGRGLPRARPSPPWARWNGPIRGTARGSRRTLSV